MAQHHGLFAQHRHLREREQPLSSDVAEAISRIVGLDGKNMPVAITKMGIVDELIDIAHEGEDDQPDMIPLPAARRAMVNSWGNRLATTDVFQSGYKHFEARAEYGNFPVVPVTDYFFKVVYNNGTVSDVLDAMSEHELMNSLPKRRGRVRAGGEGTEFIRDEHGEIATFGELAGIVVFPRGSNFALHRRWLGRVSNLAIGQSRNAVAALQHLRPDAKSVENLAVAVDGMSSIAARALPKAPTNGKK